MAAMASRVWDRLRAASAEQFGGRGWRPGRATPLREGYLRAEFGVDDEAAIKAAVRRVRGNTMTSFERLATLWQQVRYLDRYGIGGALVECGTWRGGSVGMMALAHLATDPSASRRIHLFDSFEGLPEPTAKDGTKAARYARGRATGALDTIDACTAPLEDNRALLEGSIGYPNELLTYHQGWFQQTVPAAAPSLGPIALLRLDGDWYESTVVCLQQLYVLVPPGGVVVIDDYGHWEGARRAVDEFVAAVHEPILLSHIDYTGRYWVRQAPAGTV
jgi:O-methyltransferase